MWLQKGQLPFNFFKNIYYINILIRGGFDT